MHEPHRDDLLSEADKQQVTALSTQRAHDRAQRCSHQVLVKVIDRLGMMTSAVVEGELITSAPVLEAHYECQDCGRVMLQTANVEAIDEYNTHLEMTAKFVAVAEAINGVRQALR